MHRVVGSRAPLHFAPNFLLMLLLLPGCEAELLHGLDERSANEVVAALDESGVCADKADDERPGTFKVVVPRGEQAGAVRVLAARELPRAGGHGVAEAFAEAGLLPSSSSERARFQAALAVDLQRTLEALPGASLARVHLALPEPDPLRDDGAHPRPTASVVLRTRGPATFTDGEVRRIVAGAVEGMQLADVTVLLADESTGAGRAPSTAAYTRVGPLLLAPGSASIARWLIAAALSLFALLSAALILVAARLRQARA